MLKSKTWAVVVYDHPFAVPCAAFELCHGHWLYCMIRLDLYRLFNDYHSWVIYPVLPKAQLRADGLLRGKAP